MPYEMAQSHSDDDDDDVYYYIRWRLKPEGETENMGVCTKERKGVTAAVLMAMMFNTMISPPSPIPVSVPSPPKKRKRIRLS